jgi:hypothetical protein
LGIGTECPLESDAPQEPPEAIALLEILGTQLIGHLAIVIYPVCGDKDVQTVAKFLNPK